MPTEPNENRTPSLNAIRTFAAAARHRSLTGAARELGVTQSAVSRMVLSLEAELGVQLFLRTGRSIELTAVGAEFHRRVAGALDEISAASRAVRAEPSEVLTITALPTFTQRWLVPRLPRFRLLHPDIPIDVSVAERLVEFGSEPIDLGVRLGMGQWPGATATRLLAERVGVFAAPALAVSMQGKPPATLAQRPLLQHTTRPEAWARYLGAYGAPRPDLSRAPGFEHFFMVIEAAIAGMGLALLPELFVRDELATGRLVQIDVPTQLSDASYWIVHARGAARTRRVRVFKEWLLAEAKRS